MGDPLPVNVVALDPVLEAGATSALSSSPDISVVPPDGTARVAVVIVDQVTQQELDLISSTRTAAHRPEVVLVATDLAPAEALRAIAAGARGLLRRREASPHRLVRTVLTSAVGDCTVPPDLIDRLLEHGVQAQPQGAARRHATGWGLDDRELAVLRLVADGRETDEIARQLCYSTRTVTTVIRDITQRYRLRNRAHAVAYALRAGLL
ncbi:response regulator transcription factor [Streptomyces sp. NPDC092296]|uniref:helix-turn-helix transcriptional regulator n=1 Tax=Streptomyces sp. NPDC092296 TaxID=3366012 RepID=UPI003817A9A8